MAARKRSKEVPKTRRKPATTPEARENEMVSLATDLAEEQIRSGTASSQVLTHFLKLGSTRERVEQTRIEGEIELQKAKIESYASHARVEELYVDAIGAMRAYSGAPPPEEPDDED